jgi:hypothetical protein
MTENDIVDFCRVQPGSVQDGFDYSRAEFGG